MRNLLRFFLLSVSCILVITLANADCVLLPADQFLKIVGQPASEFNLKTKGGQGCSWDWRTSKDVDYAHSSFKSINVNTEAIRSPMQWSVARIMLKDQYKGTQIQGIGAEAWTAPGDQLWFLSRDKKRKVMVLYTEGGAASHPVAVQDRIRKEICEAVDRNLRK